MVYCVAFGCISFAVLIAVVVKTFHFSVFRPREAARPENGNVFTTITITNTTERNITI